MIDDKGDLKITSIVIELMSEIKANNSKEAEGTPLLIGDGSLPIWLENILSSIAVNTPSSAQHEQAFLAVIFILMYETGFYFIEGPRNTTITYDIRLMRQFNDSSIVMKNLKKDNNSQYVIEFSHNLIYPKTIKIVAYTIINVFKEPIIVINFLFPDGNKVESFMFDTKLYIRQTSSRLGINNNEWKNVSIKLKNHLYSYKISVDPYYPHHILNLPPHILQQLMKYLDCRSFVSLIRSCKYLYDMFYGDESLWKYFSSITFRGMNKVDCETWRAHYKYLTLKEKAQRNRPAVILPTLYSPFPNVFNLYN